MYATRTCEEMRLALENEGLKKADITHGIKLMQLIGFLDGEIFPQNPLPFRFSRKLNGDNPLGYCSLVKKESYVMYVPSLNRRIAKEMKSKNPIFLIKGRNNEYENSRLTYEEILVEFSVHEVRHRLQHANIKKFLPAHAFLINDTLLRKIIRWKICLFESLKETFVREGKSSNYIKQRLASTEFDADVIALLAVYKIHQRKLTQSVLRKIVEIIKKEPAC